MNDQAPSFSLARRWAALLNVAISTAAVLAIVVMVNHLATRHFQRFHLAAHSQTRLSGRTLQVLARLTNTVHVTVYFDARGNEEIYDRVVGLLKEYQAACPKIEVERVDYIRDAVAARAVKAKYQLTQLSDKDLVIFDCQGRTRTVSASDLSDYDLRAVLEQRSKEVRRTHFRGELAFTSAIFGVSTPRALKACFLQGHGEYNPENLDQAIGYSKLAAVLKEECNIPWERLSLLTAAEVPADCSLLIIAGPTDRFSREELAKLQRYLDQGGRMLAMFNAYSLGKPTGLEKFLAQYDVAVGDDLVMDTQNSPKKRGDLVPADLGNHVITAPFHNRGVHLMRPRSIREAKASGPRPGSATVTELLLTGPNSMVASDFVKGVPRRVDPTNAVPLMAAVEKGAVPGVGAERGATRLAVIGECTFLQNDAIESVANRDFAAQVVNWLVDQTIVLSDLAPRPIKYYRVTMTQAELSATCWILLAGMPGLVILMGSLVWWRRRT